MQRLWRLYFVLELYTTSSRASPRFVSLRFASPAPDSIPSLPLQPPNRYPNGSATPSTRPRDNDDSARFLWPAQKSLRNRPNCCCTASTPNFLAASHLPPLHTPPTHNTMPLCGGSKTVQRKLVLLYVDDTRAIWTAGCGALLTSLLACL